MWSVVHFPFTLIRTLMSVRSDPIHLSKGESSWSRSEVGETSTMTPEPSSGGAWRFQYRNVPHYSLACVYQPGKCPPRGRIPWLGVRLRRARPASSQSHRHIAELKCKTNNTMNLTEDWSGVLLSVNGLKSREPARVSATVISGLVTKQ